MVDRSYGNNTHCALIVRLSGRKYLTDPGFCLSRPIEITPKEAEVKLPHNTFIITPSDGDKYRISTVQDGKKKSRYVLKDMPVNAAEFLRFWEASFNWPMMRHLCVTRLSENGYMYLRDNFLRRVSSGEKAQTRIKRNFDAEVAKVFGISEEIVRLASNIVIGRRHSGASRNPVPSANSGPRLAPG
jgi:arylamine N-acetyltransferase